MTRRRDFGFGTQIRKSPYFDATVRWGATGFSVYNHMYMPTGYGDPAAEYRRVTEGAALWDVAAERQVEIAAASPKRRMGVGSVAVATEPTPGSSVSGGSRPAGS
mgnify:CR=1 FL=1